MQYEACPDLLPYAIDAHMLLALLEENRNEIGACYDMSRGIISFQDHPSSIAQHALAGWNAYLAHRDDEQKEFFLKGASWLLIHKSLLSNGACGWPVLSSSDSQNNPQPYLSASIQGLAVSVLVRAYQLTGREAFLQTAHQAVRTFELDILDGGVSTPIGDQGVFFEGLAIYPASHVLSGHILALFGLYDYVAFTHAEKIEELIQQGTDTLHIMIDEFDAGYWTRRDLLHKELASRSYHSLHIALLEALSRFSRCGHCAVLASHWVRYQYHPGSQLFYLVISRGRLWWNRKLKLGLRRLIFRAGNKVGQTRSTRICIPITAFPVAGGMHGVLAGLAQVMHDRWEIVYLTRHKGQNAAGLEIETFGRKRAVPWQFPFVWIYCLAGWCKLLSLLRHSPGYDLILPQDGVFTGAFAALAGKMAGVRVVCMDHGHMTLLDSPTFRKERTRVIEVYSWHRRVVARLQWACYWPSQRLLARLATYCTDQFLVAGDEVETVYRERLAVHPSRIIRYAYMLDVTRFTPPDNATRARIRTIQGIPDDAIMITLINRLAPEKGLHLAIEGIDRALSTLSKDVRERVKVVIAGDGPLRTQLEKEIKRHRLDSVCTLRGEAAPTDVVTLLAISDIFIYNGTRGTNYSMAVLEAMAAGCAVIASVRPQSNAKLLADGRGIAISGDEAEQISEAIVRLANDTDLCHRMGHLARNYIETQHNATLLRRTLLRATYWSALHDFLGKSEPALVGERMDV